LLLLLLLPVHARPLAAGAASILRRLLPVLLLPPLLIYF
jgi:hypothetical protein